MKRIFSFTLAAVMSLSALPVAYAIDVDYTNGTTVVYTANNEANREYSITVPASLEPGKSGAVTLKGKWASNETVKVTADTSVELVNSINSADKKTLAVTFAGIEKAGDNTVEKTYTETVEVEEMPADALFGTWSGKFNYNVEFVDEAAELISFDITCVKGGTFQAEKGMTWEQWVNSEYNTANIHIDGGTVCDMAGDPIIDVAPTTIIDANATYSTT